jgi:hypothetical protein
MCELVTDTVGFLGLLVFLAYLGKLIFVKCVIC